MERCVGKVRRPNQIPVVCGRINYQPIPEHPVRHAPLDNVIFYDYSPHRSFVIGIKGPEQIQPKQIKRKGRSEKTEQNYQEIY
jgi:hypothetical protein